MDDCYMYCDFSISCHNSGVITIDALHEGNLVGSLVAQLVDDNCRIDSLVVVPAHRGEHLSYELLSQLRHHLMLNAKANTIEASFGYLDKPLMDHYNYIFAATDYRFEPQELSMEFLVGDIALRKAFRSTMAMPFSSLPPMQIAQIASELYSRGMVDKQYSLPANTDMDISFAMCQLGRPLAFLWMTQVREGLYRIGAIQNRATPAILIRLILSAISNVKDTLPADSRVVLEVYSTTVQRIILKLTKDKAQVSSLTSRFVYYLWGK